MNAAAALAACLLAADAEARSSATAQTVVARRSAERAVEFCYYASHDVTVLREVAPETGWQPVASILPNGTVETFHVTNLFPEAHYDVR